MGKHTPGPWITEISQWGDVSVKSANESDLAEWPVEYFIADKIGGHVHGEDFTDFSEVHANANLIAAAPDLLKALERLLDSYMAETGYQVAADLSVDEARVAIAKATGEQQ